MLSMSFYKKGEFLLENSPFKWFIVKVLLLL